MSLRKIAEHPARSVLGAGRLVRVAAHAHAQPGEATLAELLHDGAQAVVAAVTAALPQADDAEVEVDLVVDDEHLRNLDRVERHRALHGEPREVHEFLRLHEHALGAADHAGRRLGALDRAGDGK